MRSSTLKIHYKKHITEVPYKCSHPHCGVKFYKNSDMQHHQILHEFDPESNMYRNDLTDYSDLGFVDNYDKKDSQKRGKTEDSNMIIPINIIDQEVREQKLEILAKKEKSLDICDSKGYFLHPFEHYQNNNAIMSVGTPQMRCQSPLSNKKVSNPLNFCTSPMANFSNSPKAFTPFSRLTFNGTASIQNSPPIYSHDLKENESIITFKPFTTSAFMNSPMAFSSFDIGNSPSILSGLPIKPSSFSLLARSYENTPGTPLGLFSYQFDKLSNKSAVPFFVGTPLSRETSTTNMKSNFHIEDFESASTKTPGSENTKMEDFDKPSTLKN
jgi:hypothetical protein